MWVAVLKRFTVVLAVLALLGAVPAMAAPFAPAGMLDCGAVMADTAAEGAPCDPAAPQKSQPACQATAMGCTVAALPGPVPQVALLRHTPRSWNSNSSSILLGRAIKPNIFPPILSA